MNRLWIKLLGAFGVEFNYIYCLLFGALVAPTDPVAVLGILKKVGVPRPASMIGCRKMAKMSNLPQC